MNETSGVTIGLIFLTAMLAAAFLSQVRDPDVDTGRMKLLGGMTVVFLVATVVAGVLTS